MASAFCHACGAEKDLALARCAACRVLPEGDARALAVLCSSRMLDEGGRAAARARVLRGERLAPSEALLARAHAVLRGEEPAHRQLSPREAVGLSLASLLVTPLLAWLAWMRWRTLPGNAGPSALRIALLTSAASIGAWAAWRTR